MSTRKIIALVVVSFLCALQAPAEEIVGLPLHIQRLGDRGVRLWLGEHESTTAVAALATAEGIVIIDTTEMPSVDAQYRRIIARELGRSDFRLLINTHGHVDHVAGNSVYADCQIVAHERAVEDMKHHRDRVGRVVEYFQQRLPEMEAELAAADNSAERAKLYEKLQASKARLAAYDGGITWTLPNVVFSDRMSLDMGDTTFELSYAGGIHSPGDIFVFVPERGLLFTGDLMADKWLSDSAGCLTSFDIRYETPHDFPLLLANWQRLVEREDEIRTLLPGHWNGELSFAGFEARYRYVKTLWEGIAAAAAAGQSLDEVQASFALAARFPELESSPGFSQRYNSVSVVSLWREITGTRSAAFDLREQIDAEGLASALAACREAHANATGDRYFSETEFNAIGYRYLGGGELDEAVAVFELNSELYPGSWNVWDSLAEARLAAGDHSAARELYRRSLELNPENHNAVAALERIAAEGSSTD